MSFEAALPHLTSKLKHVRKLDDPSCSVLRIPGVVALDSRFLGDQREREDGPKTLESSPAFERMPKCITEPVRLTNLSARPTRLSRKSQRAHRLPCTP